VIGGLVMAAAARKYMRNI